MDIGPNGIRDICTKERPVFRGVENGHFQH